MVTLAFVGFDMVTLVLGRNFMVSPTLIGSFNSDLEKVHDDHKSLGIKLQKHCDLSRREFMGNSSSLSLEFLW